MLSALPAAAAASAAGATSAASAQAGPAATPLPGSAIPFTRTATVIGAAPAARRLSIQVWLRPRLAAAQRFAAAVSTPGRPGFGHFLSPDAWTARFGASPGTARAVAAWLRTAGFTSVHADAQRDYVRGTASTATIETALRVRLRLYRPAPGVTAGRYALRANDRAVFVPSFLASRVLGVTGLDNAAPLIPLIRTRTAGPAAAHATSRRDRHGHQGPVLAVLRAAPCDRPARPVRRHVVPDRRLRLRRGPAALGLRRDRPGGRPRSAHRAGGARPEPGHVPDAARLRPGRRLPAPPARPVRQRSLGRGNACGDPFDGEEQIDVEAS